MSKWRIPDRYTRLTNCPEYDCDTHIIPCYDCLYQTIQIKEDEEEGHRWKPYCSLLDEILLCNGDYNNCSWYTRREEHNV